MIGAVTATLAARTPRERWLMAGLGVALVGWGLWAGALLPLQAHTSTLQDRIHRHTLALPRVAALPPAAAAPPPDARPLPVIVAETAAEAGLDLRRLQDRGGAVSVQIDAAPFDAVMLWIETLELRAGLRLAAVAMARQDAPGTVSVTVEVAR